MSDYIAALPMYDWPERHAEVDAEWAALRSRLRAAGVEAPAALVRRNADMPAVPGGIRDAAGQVIAPDPATLPADELDFHTLWVHPKLLFGQACWGPMELGLGEHVQVAGQPDYSNVEGGQGAFYSSVIVMRADGGHVSSPADGQALLPLDLIRGKRFTYNSLDSMSGSIALGRDIEAVGESRDIFSERIQSGGHRSSIIAVAQEKADVATIDCLSWALAQRFEPAAKGVAVVGWTALRKGLPYICSRHLPHEMFQSIRVVIGGNAPQ